MNGKTYAYLELAGLPPIGAVLLDPRPAFVFSGDGRNVLFANAAGMAFLEEERMGAVLVRQFAAGSPLSRQLAKLAKLLPTETPRLEMLRFNLGGGPKALPAACRRLNLPDGTSAVLAVGMVEAGRESLATRAEQLADAMASRDCLVAVLSREGRVFGASGGFTEVTPASEAIDELVDDVVKADVRLLKRQLAIDGVTRPAGVARFENGGQPLFLLIVGPEEKPHPVAATEGTEPTTPRSVTAEVTASAAAEAVGVAEPLPEPPRPDEPLAVPTGSAETVSERDPAVQPAAEGAPAPPAKPQALRFLWQLDGDLRFGFVSPELAEAVGPGNAAIAGRTWNDIAARLALDPDSSVAEALATHANWGGIAVHWPIEDRPERVAVDLAAFAVTGRDHRFDGFRGIGTVRLGDRVAEDRPIVLGPPDEPAVTEAAPAAPVEAIADSPIEAASPAPAEPAVPPAASGVAGQVEPAVALPVSEPASASAEQPVAPEPPEAPTALEAPAIAERRPVHPPLVLSEADIDDAARKSIEQGQRPANRAPGELIESPLVEEEIPSVEREAVALPAAVPAASNIVRLPGPPARTPPPERLTGSEQDAFRRIAEALGVRMTADIEEAAEEARRRAEDMRTRPAAAAAAASEVDARILDKLPAGIIIYRDRKTLFVNRALLDLLGYDNLDTFVAAGGAEAIFPEATDGAPRPALSESGGALFARRRDGSGVPVDARLHAVPWAGATALMLSVMKRSDPKPEAATDQTLLDHLIQAERRIDELQAILDTATDGIIVIDKDGRIDNINRSAEALFGVEATEVIRRPFTELLADESRKAALDYLDGLAENGVASVLNDGREVIGKVPKGGLIPMFMTMGRLGEGPKFCAVLRDITHWKNVEEELVAAKRSAETANAQKSEFLAKISHEIRTPLNAIIGFSEVMMEERFGPVGSERYRDYLRDIHVSGTHMLSLINDLLDLSKIEAGKLELSFESVAVNEVIQECVALMQAQANRERIIIRTSLSAGVPNVVADERSLRQILLNLLSNAIKFTGAGGQVIVATTLEDTGEVTLRIRDTGVGMSEKDVETAMKPFRQVGSRGRGRGEGTGLGLPLTKALVEANRATFAIDSAPNQGTLVKVTFPTTRVLAG